MYFDLSKPQKLFAQSVREFCQREFPAARVRELMQTDAGMDDRLWQEFADQGWLGLHVGETYDGLALGTVDLAVLAEEFGRACVPGRWLATTWAATLLEASGDPPASQWLPALIDGSVKFTVAAIEPECSWNFTVDHCRTILKDGRLNGKKQLVQHAGQADWILLPVNVEGHLGLVIVSTSADGVQIARTPGIDATRTLYEVTFDNVALADANLLATRAAAVAAWERALKTTTVVAAAEMLGLQEWMLAETVEYAKTRQQFGKAIGSFQAVQQMCAEILQLTESARAAVWYAAWAVQEGTDDATQAVSVAKAYTSDAARRCGNLAVQTHGGIGFTWEHDLHLYYKRAKANEYLFGDASFHRDRLAAAVLD
jgi:alkylation response protein AidB-like acyl-CoA dehydrogenase